jgi:hypothetical protein
MYMYTHVVHSTISYIRIIPVTVIFLSVVFTVLKRNQDCTELSLVTALHTHTHTNTRAHALQEFCVSFALEAWDAHFDTRSQVQSQ